ncbi:uncharacterized protein J8A68_003928 [[Candida] subhashii]|uniref:Acyl-protein thioesterase 1 n=1 Tax=[Candida] subhashii TaxID=561895 RepID=A0A8J5UXT0_9ASCO|nr:uncharacterized protein J8A68_003928 [[Candida] subhashii]KAG7662554.1 hypothetical protein J8A68_003928 [[Candida] subhashii]
MTSVISAIRISSKSLPPTAAVIFLHGLGDTGDGWSWFPQLIAQTKILNSHESINYVFPNAPQQPVTANQGYVMPSWFDIFEFGNPNARQDVDGFFKACETLKSIIKEQIEVYKVPPGKIIIGGFSQGAAVSLATIATLDFKIGGCVALSGFCPIAKEIESRINSSNFDTPIFQGHGSADPLINFDHGLKTSELYKRLGFNKLSFHRYQGVAHSASDQELIDVVKFLKQVLE